MPSCSLRALSARTRSKTTGLKKKLVAPAFLRSAQYKSARAYVTKEAQGRSGRSPISRPGWFNRVESEVVRKERNAIAAFRSPDFKASLNALPAAARKSVIDQYRVLRQTSGRLQRLGRGARYTHEQTPASLKRSFFDERVEKILRNPGRKPLSFAVVDLDFFGQINKKFGHAVGNLVMERFTEMFKAELGNVGFYGRVGGDEFQVCARLPPVQLAQLLNRFRGQLATALTTPSFLREVEALKSRSGKMKDWVPLSFTAGVTGTTRHTKKIQNAGALFRSMDHEMQRGKRKGRGMTLSIHSNLAA